MPSNVEQLRSRDPISLVYATLWDILEDHTPFCDLVKPGNRVKFVGAQRSPLKREVQAADLPEVRIVATGGTALTHAASGLATFSRTFEFQVASGDQRYDAALWPVEWEILRALRTWPRWMDALRWRGQPFVDLVEVTAVKEGAADVDLKRDIEGWTAVWASEVKMSFAQEILFQED